MLKARISWCGQRAGVILKVLSKSEQQLYQQRGFFLRQSVFSAAECECFRAAALRVESLLQVQAVDCGESPAVNEYHLDGKRFVDYGHVTAQFEHLDAKGRLRVVEPINDVEPLFDRLIDDPRLSEPMKQLVPGQRLALWTAKLNFKHPLVGSGFGWHQDAPYWLHDSGHVSKLPNVMVLFDDATEDNGCFRVIDGSHKKGCLPGCDDERQLAGFYTHPDAFDEASAVSVEAPAGSAIFFDPYIVHGSGPNKSPLPRRAIIITYQPAGFAALKSGRLREVWVP